MIRVRYVSRVIRNDFNDLYDYAARFLRLWKSHRAAMAQVKTHDGNPHRDRRPPTKPSRGESVTKQQVKSQRRWQEGEAIKGLVGLPLRGVRLGAFAWERPGETPTQSPLTTKP